MSDLSALDRFRQLASRGRAAGSAEVSARTHIVGYWYRAPLYGRALIVGATVGLGAFLGVLAGYPPLTSAAVVLAAILAVGAFLLAPQLLATVLVAVLTAPLFVPLGAFYTLNSAPPGGDPVGGAIALSVAYAVGLWVAARWSRGRVWVTASLMSASLLFLAPFAFFVWPSLGLNAARLALAIVLVLRCGGISWVTGLVGLALARVKERSHVDDAEGYAAADPGDVSAAWKRLAAVERETARLLSSLPREFRVFHDVLPPKGAERIGHMVIGPGGVLLIASVHATAPIQESTPLGLQIPGVDLDGIIAGLIANKPLVARALKVHPRDVSLLVVVHSKEPCMEKRIRVAVHQAAAPGKAMHNIALVPGSDLETEIVNPFASWGRSKTQQTMRRAQIKMRPAVLPAFAARPDDSESTRFSIAKVDEDGRIIDLADGSSSYAPGALRAGARVDVLTTLGPLKGLRVTSGPVIGKQGERVIYVCPEEEYLEGSLTGSRPKGHPFPVGSVRLADVTTP